jgi:cell division protein FtsI/penicillin-binding protein 2
MRGLYISFVIKRRKKIDKVMDFFLVFAIFIFIFTFLFYVQYVQKENKYNSTNKSVQTKNAEAAALKEQVDKMDKENTSALEKSYNVAYTELSAKTDEVAKYSGYIKDIYDKRLAGVTINGIEVNTMDAKITLTLSFDRSIDSQVDYRYRATLLDLDWIPKNGIQYEDTNLSTQWEVLINGTTVEE